MRVAIRHKLGAARRVLAYCAAHPDPTPAAAASVSRLQALLARVAALEATHQRDQAAARQALEERNRMEDGMRALLTHLVRLCRAVVLHEGLDDLRLELRLRPRGPSLLQKGVAAALARASGHRDLLLRYGLPPNLLPELEQGLEAYRRAEERRKTSQAASLQAASAIECAAAEAHNAIRHLDALNRIRFAADPQTLAEWETARSIPWGLRRGWTALGPDPLSAA